MLPPPLLVHLLFPFFRSLLLLLSTRSFFIDGGSGGGSMFLSSIPSFFLSLSTPREIGLQILSSLLSRAVFFLRLDSLSSIAHVRRLVRKTWWPEGRRLYSVGDRHETFAFWRCWRNRFADGSNFRWLDGSRDTREQEREHKTLLSRKERWLSS